MSPRMVELALRRQRLEFQAETQRRELAESLAPFLPAFATVDSINRGVRYLRDHPEIPALAALVIFILRPSKAMRWARRGVSAWRLWGGLRRRLTGV